MSKASTNLPDPPVPADADLRHFDRMPLDLQALNNSETWAVADGWASKALINLWCRAWHQVPAGSLPDSDAIAKQWAGVPNWDDVRDVALRGFELHRDGRLYHKHLCTLVNEALEKSRRYQEAGSKGAKARWKKKKTKNGPANSDANGDANAIEQTSPDQGYCGRNADRWHRSRREDSPPKSPPRGSYAFEGKVVRLNLEDFDRWKQGYPNLDLRAELTALDDWYAENLDEAQRKQWFTRCSNALAKRNRERRPEAGNGNGGEPGGSAVVLSLEEENRQRALLGQPPRRADGSIDWDAEAPDGDNQQASDETGFLNREAVQ